MPLKNKITEDAAFVEFDYRCLIDETYAVLDMQQWHKIDVVKRFFMYFCNNTSLQLETLSSISVPLDGNRELLLAARKVLLDMLDNKTKGMDFLSKNRLIFMFQPNIVKNLKKQGLKTAYSDWFQFAAKSRKKNNKESDFTDYQYNAIFSQIMDTLKIENLPESEFTLITDYEAHNRGVENYRQMLFQVAEMDHRDAIDALQKRFAKERQAFEAKAAQAAKEKQDLETRVSKAAKEKQDLAAKAAKECPRPTAAW